MRLLKHLYFVYNHNIFTYQLLMPLFFYFLAFNLATANENREKINLLTEVDFDFTLSFELSFFSLLFFFNAENFVGGTIFAACYICDYR